MPSGSFGPHYQAFELVQPVNSLVVHLPALSSQHDMDTAAPIADPRHGNLPDPHS
jgi:hypothetical protein